MILTANKEKEVSNEVEERLAAKAHDVWCEWMKHMLGKCQIQVGALDADNGLFIPIDLVERWTRQMNTKFEDLPEAEKLSDRCIAGAYLNIVRKYEQENTTAQREQLGYT